MDLGLQAFLPSYLFAGISLADARKLLAAMRPRRQTYADGAVILMQGEKTSDIGVVAKGRLVATRLTPDGVSVRVSEVAPAGVFGDVLSGSSGYSPVMLTAQGDTEIYLVAIDALLGSCSATCAAHKTMLKNFITIISDKYFAQNRRLMLLVEPTIRGRVLAYLLEFGLGERGMPFSVPHNREQQAQYLGCERSALSRELGNMKRDGLIDCHGRTFTLL